jgi:hypothetical protein
MNRRRMVGTTLSSLLALPLASKPAAPDQGEDPASLYEKEIPLFDLGTQGDLGQGPAITQTSQWEKKRQLIKDKWIRDILGPFPNKVPLDVQVRDTVEYPDYTFKQIDFASEADDRMNAYLLFPKPLGRAHAAIMALHPSNGHCGNAVVGLSQDDADWWFGRDLVRRGFVVLAPDILSVGERIFPGLTVWDTKPFYEKHPEWSVMGKMLWDHMCGVDVLQTLDYVDPKRIGATGWSLGGHNTGFLAAFDDRIAAAVSDGGMIPITGDSHPFRWCLPKFFYMPRMRPYLERGSVPFDLHEIMALIAPRPYVDMNSAPADTWWKSGVAAAARCRFAVEGGHNRTRSRIPQDSTP